MTTTLRTNQRHQPLVREYGCTSCQRAGLPHWHREGIDPEYTEHLIWQSKHGTSERIATPNEVLAIVRRAS